MTTKGGSGFDEATARKFNKVIAMFDSEFSEEADTAFKLLHAELRRKNLKFCDHLVPAEYAETARNECAEVRSELRRLMEEKKRGGDIQELAEIIDRLHERIREMEENAAASDGPPPPQSEIPASPNDAATPSSQNEIPASQNDAAPPPVHDAWLDLLADNSTQPVHEDDADSETFESVSPLPLWHSIFWGGLLALVLVYSVFCFLIHHFMTAREWESGLSDWRIWIVYGVVCYACVALFYGGLAAYSHTRPVQWFATLSSLRSMALALWLVAALSLVAYIIWDQDGVLDNPVHAALRLAVFVPLFVWSIWKVVQNLGWMGLLYKTALFVDGSFIYLCWRYETINPWSPHSRTVPHYSAYIFGFLVLFSLLLVSNWFTRWLLDYEDAARWVVLPALGLVMITVFVVATQPAPASAPIVAKPSLQPPAKPLHHSRKIHVGGGL